MPNWNLSVNLRGDGAQLGRSLRDSARFARALADSSRLAQRDVRALGTTGGRIRALGSDTQFAARHMRTLGQDARTAARLTTQAGERSAVAGRNVRTLGTDANTAARHLRTLGTASRDAARNQQAAARAAGATAREFQRMAVQMRSAARDMQRLAVAARTTATRTRAVGDDGARSMGRLAGATSRARSHMLGLAGLLAGGGLLLGLGELVKEGNAYQKQMNTFGAVTGANALQMQRAGAVAHQLGSDLSLPASTAADAAEAMVDLAKAGFRADQAIAASRSALELSTGLHVKAADAAMYLGDVMDQFGLGADQAAKAADTLAATSTGASGGIRDIWYAMKYAGPVANALGVSMQDTAAAIVGLGKAGIIGQTAGTTLRGAFSNLAAPTDQMTQGLKTLGIEAFDSQGKFKGLATIVEGLHTAQGKLTNQEFVGAVKKAFGKPAMSGMIALGHQGVDAFETYRAAVSQTGKAADIAGAQSKGLTGAMTQLRTQAKTTGLAIYEGISPGLEYLTRGITAQMAAATPKIAAFFKHINDLATLFGPDIKAAIGRTFSGIGHDAGALLGPLKTMAAGNAAAGLHLLLSAGQALVTVLKHLVSGVEPVVHALGSVAAGGHGMATILDTVVYAVDHALSLLGQLSGVLVPLGHVVGGLVSAFGQLPGPVQAAFLAMMLARRVAGPMSGLATTVGGRLTGAFRSLNGQMAVQRSLAASAGMSIGRYGAAFAVLQTRIPVLGRMAGSFRTASAASAGLSGSLRGVAAAAGTGLAAAGRGLMGAMGGPWGLAITAASVGLGILASHQQKAAQAAAEHQQQIATLSQALRESNGAVTANVRAIAAERLMHESLGTSAGEGKKRLQDLAAAAQVSMGTIVDAYTNQGTSLAALRKQLNAIANDPSHQKWSFDENGTNAKGMDVQARAAHDLALGLGGLQGEFSGAAADAKTYNDAVNGTAGGTTAYDKLKGAVQGLADTTADADSRTRALKDALDLLAGGTVSFQAAQARVNEAVTNGLDQAKSAADAHKQALADGTKYIDGWGKQLITAAGAVDTVTRNGQGLYNSLTSITDATGNAALAAYDLAQKQKKGLPESLQAAKDAMQKSREEAIKVAEQYGLTAGQAAKVADSMGLIPGKVAILLQAQGVDTTLADLLGVQAMIQQTPSAKFIKVETLSEEAKAKLIDLGYKVETLPGSREIKITLPVGSATSNVAAIQSAIDSVQGKTVTIHVQYQGLSGGDGVAVKGGRYANGAVVDYFADGGVQRGGVRQFATGTEKHVAQIAPAGSWRVWGEPETGGEAYIPLSPAKRARSRAIARETITRLGGDPSAIKWHANGSITDWRYDPSTGSLYSPSDAGQAAHKTKKVGKEDVSYFDEGALERKLTTSAAAARRWNTDLTKVAERAGSDVAKALAAMGEDGVQLTHKMATGTTKYVNEMANSLRELAKTARASLTDYTRQLNTASNTNTAFATNLAKLAAAGYGDLAAQLSAQGDEAAQQLAADAVKNHKKAAGANAQAKRAGAQMTSDQVTEMVQIIAAVTSNKVGIHQVADATGIGEDEIVTVAGKAAPTIRNALGARGSRFLTDLAKAQRGMAFENGGIRAGMYATQGGIVRFAEPSTGGEAYIPLGANKRATATNVLHDVAGRFGLGVAPAGAARPIVIIRETGGTTVNVPITRTNASATDIASQVGRQMRRARRGGVAARA